MGFGAILVKGIKAVCTFLGEIEPVLKVISTVIEIMAPVIQKLGQSLGLIDKDEKCEDLGARALNAEADGVVPENFDSFDEYLQVVRKYSPETDKPITERLEMGTKLIMGLIEEKYPELDSKVYEVIAKNPDLANEGIASEIGKLMKDGDLAPKDLSNYLLNKPMSDNDLDRMDKVMIDIEKKNNPGLSDGDAYKKIAKIRM